MFATNLLYIPKIQYVTIVLKTNLEIEREEPEVEKEKTIINSIN